MAAACDSDLKCVYAAVVHSELNSHQLILIRLSYFLKTSLISFQQYAAIYALAVCMGFSLSNGEITMSSVVAKASIGVALVRLGLAMLSC